jgi:acyl carrier protein
MYKTTNEEILEILKTISNLPNLTINQLLLDEGIIDSLSTIELISILEERFAINIEADDLNHFNFNTISAISNLVNSK